MDDKDVKDKLHTSNRATFQSMGDHQKAIEKYEKDLKIAIEKGDRGSPEFELLQFI